MVTGRSRQRLANMGDSLARSKKVEGFCCPVPSKPLNSLLLPGGFNRA